MPNHQLKSENCKDVVQQHKCVAFEPSLIQSWDNFAIFIRDSFQISWLWIEYDRSEPKQNKLNWQDLTLRQIIKSHGS